MTFKSALWQPIALGLTAINVAGIGWAIGVAEAGHAVVHAALAAGFGAWALGLRKAPAENEREAQLELIEQEMSTLRQELSETQERLDFAERLLARGHETRRMDPER